MDISYLANKRDGDVTTKVASDSIHTSLSSRPKIPVQPRILAFEKPQQNTNATRPPVPCLSPLSSFPSTSHPSPTLDHHQAANHDEDRRPRRRPRRIRLRLRPRGDEAHDLAPRIERREERIPPLPEQADDRELFVLSFPSRRWFSRCASLHPAMPAHSRSNARVALSHSY